MKTIGDVHNELSEKHRDSSRDKLLSEYGLTEAEIDSHVADYLDLTEIDGVMEAGGIEELMVTVNFTALRAIIEQVFGEGIVTGMEWERQRRK